MKLWYVDHNQVLQDILKEFEVVDKLEDADRVVLWNDVNAVERGIIALARGKKIPTIVMQHGRKGTSKYYPPFNEEITADRLLVWGESDKEALIEAGRDPKKIRVTGSTVFSHLIPKKEHKGINIVFCPEHWDKEVDENLEIVKKLRQLKKVNIITKLIEVHDPSLYDNPVISDRRKSNHLDICAEVLSTADLVVSVSESTFELMAQTLDIPVVVMSSWQPKAFGGDNRYADYRRVVSEASKQADMDNLLEVIQEQLNNPGELSEYRKQASIDEGGTNLDALKEIKNGIIG